jgi:ribosome-associated protein
LQLKTVLEGAIKLEELIQIIASAADEKKALDIVALDFRNLEGAITDAFIICSAASERQIDAIKDNILSQMEAKSLKPHHIEGNSLKQWILIDYIDLVVHIFLEEVREFYRLENLWAHAKKISFSL